MLGVALTHVQDLVELYAQACQGPSGPQPFPPACPRTTQLGVVGELAEGALSPQAC